MFLFFRQMPGVKLFFRFSSRLSKFGSFLSASPLPNGLKSRIL